MNWKFKACLATRLLVSPPVANSPPPGLSRLMGSRYMLLKVNTMGLLAFVQVERVVHVKAYLLVALHAHQRCTVTIY